MNFASEYPLSTPTFHNFMFPTKCLRESCYVLSRWSAEESYAEYGELEVGNPYMTHTKPRNVVSYEILL